MEPVEINAGGYYLRQLRADRLLDDRPALLEGFADARHHRHLPERRLRTIEDAQRYVDLRAEQWAGDRRYSWAIAQPTTGALLGEVGLTELDLEAGTAEVTIWTHPAAGEGTIAVTAIESVVRFGFGALDLRQVSYRCVEGDAASASVAEHAGLRLAGADPAPAPTGQRLLRWIAERE